THSSTPSLHDALPISCDSAHPIFLQPPCRDEIERGAEQIEDEAVEDRVFERVLPVAELHRVGHRAEEEDAEADADQIVDEQKARSEEHTSELQSRSDL